MPNGIPKRKVTRAVEKSETALPFFAVREAWLDSPMRGMQLITLDRVYYGLPLSVWKLMLAYSSVDSGQYLAERYDCDDFAIAFKAVASRKFAINGVGMVVDTSSGHAYCALLVVEDSQLTIKCIEPQNDSLVIIGEPMSRAERGLALF